MSKEKALRVGVVGVGSVVREIYRHLYFASSYSAGIRIAAAADPNEEGLAWFGKEAGLPATALHESHEQMLEAHELDVVQVNTPDHLHKAPTLDALAAGLDVVLPKPLAASTVDAHAMLSEARRRGRLLLVDYHKRSDPRIVECAARYRSGRYGRLQVAVLWMLDRIDVVDPNRDPPFFASPLFAETNSPVSFLTVHMMDALHTITGLAPERVRAIGYRDALPRLKPVPVDGWDMVDTEVTLAGGAMAHIITGWHLPDTAASLTVQSARMVCSDGMIDLALDSTGLTETHTEGLANVNPLFRRRTGGRLLSGYGIDHPGRLYELIEAHQNGLLPREDYERLTSGDAAGMPATLVVEAAELSLQRDGESIELHRHMSSTLGEDAARLYNY
jgi:predicted dehydrogenase